jgi:hypothetical protein
MLTIKRDIFLKTFIHFYITALLHLKPETLAIMARFWCSNHFILQRKSAQIVVVV